MMTWQTTLPGWVLQDVSATEGQKGNVLVDMAAVAVKEVRPRVGQNFILNCRDPFGFEGSTFASYLGVDDGDASVAAAVHDGVQILHTGREEGAESSRHSGTP
jgi:hypothetical protein